MKTSELAIYSIQANMLGAVVIKGNDNTCKVLLANGKHLLIKCPTKKNATDIKNTLLQYPITEGRDNNAKDFDFEFELIYTSE